MSFANEEEQLNLEQNSQSSSAKNASSYIIINETNPKDDYFTFK